MNILITGASGFVGQNMVAYLLKHQPAANIQCLLRDPHKTGWFTGHRQLSLLHGDLLSPETYRAALLDADIVLHMAALVGLRDGEEFYRFNTEATRLSVQTLQASTRLKRLVFVSSISAVDRPLGLKAEGPMDETTVPCPNTDYGKSKLAAEQLIQESGLPYTILRPSYIYGPYPRRASSMDRIVYDVRDQKPYTTMPFPGRASEIYVEDLAAGIWHAAQHENAKNEIFFIATETPAMVGSVFGQIATALGVSYTQRVASAPALVRLQYHSYLRYPAQPLVRVMFEDSFYCSSAKMKALLGWTPPTVLSDGIAKTVGWYRANGLL